MTVTDTGGPAVITSIAAERPSTRGEVWSLRGHGGWRAHDRVVRTRDPSTGTPAVGVTIVDRARRKGSDVVTIEWDTSVGVEPGDYTVAIQVQQRARRTRTSRSSTITVDPRPPGA